MFSVHTSDLDLFKKVFEVASHFVDECDIILDDKGLTIEYFDKAHILYGFFHYQNNLFTAYEIDENIRICVPVADMNKVLKRLKDYLIFEKKDNKNILIVRSNNARFKIRLFTPAVQPVPSPDIDNFKYSNRVEITTSGLTEAIKNMEIISDSCYLKIMDKHFLITSEGTSGSAEYEMTEGDLISLSSEEDVIAEFSLFYLKKILPALNYYEYATLYLRNDHPLLIQTTDMRFLIAPKVTDDFEE